MICWALLQETYLLPQGSIDIFSLVLSIFPKRLVSVCFLVAKEELPCKGELAVGLPRLGFEAIQLGPNRPTF